MDRKLSSLYLLICLSVLSARGQDAILSQFFTMPVYINPAFSGSHKGYYSVLNFRSHPLLDATNISAFNASADGFFPGLGGGLGLMVNTHYQGNLLWVNQVQGVYAYHLQLQRNWYMNLGVQAGYIGREYRWSRLEFLERGERPPENLWRHSPDLGAGVIIYSRLLYGGLAMHHLNRPRESLFGDSRLPLKFTAHLGAYLDGDYHTAYDYRQYFLSPNIIYQQQGPYQRINYGMYAGLGSVMAGVWFRQNLNNSNTLIFLAGLQFGNLGLGYSYDHSLSGFTDAWHGIHEFSLSWFIPRHRDTHQPIRCPRFF